MSRAMVYSRRELGLMMLAGAPVCALAKINSTVNGVRLGVCTYSFRDLPRVDGDAVGPVIEALKKCNAGLCELFSPQLEPENELLTKLLRELTTPGPDGK